MSSPRSEHLHSREIIDETDMSGHSINALLRKLATLTEEKSNRTTPYTMSDLSAEYAVPVPAEQQGTVAGRRWGTAISVDGIAVDCEVTVFDDSAQNVLMAAGLKDKPVAATVWFHERTLEADDSSFSLLTTIFRSGPAKHMLGRAEVTGDLTLAEHITAEQEARLFNYAKAVGGQAVFSHFAPEAAGSARDFYIEVPQMVGSDMVRAAGKLAALPQLIQ